MSSFISGGVAGVVAKTIIAPIERVKFLFIVHSQLFSKTSHRQFTYRQFFSDFKHIANKHGVLNLWRGNLMNIARVFPNSAVVALSTLRTSLSSISSETSSTKKMDQPNSNWSCIYAEHLQDWLLWQLQVPWNLSGFDYRWRKIPSVIVTT